MGFLFVFWYNLSVQTIDFLDDLYMHFFQKEQELVAPCFEVIIETSEICTSNVELATKVHPDFFSKRTHRAHGHFIS